LESATPLISNLMLQHGGEVGQCLARLASDPLTRRPPS